MRWAGDVACMGEMGNAYNTFGNPEGKRPLIRPRHRMEDIIRMHLRETGWEGVERMHLAGGGGGNYETVN
jgi:hypothetical protein